MCLPYLKFSDLLPETQLFFYLASNLEINNNWHQSGTAIFEMDIHTDSFQWIYKSVVTLLGTLSINKQQHYKEADNFIGGNIKQASSWEFSTQHICL